MRDHTYFIPLFINVSITNALVNHITTPRHSSLIFAVKYSYVEAENDISVRHLIDSVIVPPLHIWIDIIPTKSVAIYTNGYCVSLFLQVILWVFLLRTGQWHVQKVFAGFLEYHLHQQIKYILAYYMNRLKYDNFYEARTF